MLVIVNICAMCNVVTYEYLYPEFRKIYKRLDINDLIDRGESFYQPKMADTVKILDKTG